MRDRVVGRVLSDRLCESGTRKAFATSLGCDLPLEGLPAWLGARELEERRRMAYWRWKSLIDSLGAVLEAPPNGTWPSAYSETGTVGASAFRG